MTEFDLIEHLKRKNPVTRTDVSMGIGDDCALLSVDPSKELAVTTDTLIKGVHFPLDTTPESIGHKSLAVSLSDLAAVGAEPTWVTLSLSMPEHDIPWLDAFADGFFRLAEKYHVQLVGGDTTQGPLSITVQAHGLVPKSSALTRSGAQVGDYICVTGTLGEAGFELFDKVRNKTSNVSTVHLDFPAPRVEVGVGLRNIANATIDISDGLIADLGHILKASDVGAFIHLDKIPLSDKLKQYPDTAKIFELALTAGDDYELCFTMSEDKIDIVNEIQKITHIPITHIGNIEETTGLRINRLDGEAPLKIEDTGYQHFSGKKYDE